MSALLTWPHIQRCNIRGHFHIGPNIHCNSQFQYHIPTHSRSQSQFSSKNLYHHNHRLWYLSISHHTSTLLLQFNTLHHQPAKQPHLPGTTAKAFGNHVRFSHRLLTPPPGCRPKRRPTPTHPCCTRARSSYKPATISPHSNRGPSNSSFSSPITSDKPPYVRPTFLQTCRKTAPNSTISHRNPHTE